MNGLPIAVRIVIIIVGVLAALLLIGWIGLQVEPRSFAPYPRTTAAPRTMPIPAGLPAPVERFYRTVYGDQIPVIESAVMTGKVRLKPAGPLYLPGRFRITHQAGQSYRHYIEVTWFGFPVLKVNERFVDGKSRFDMPWG